MGKLNKLRLFHSPLMPLYLIVIFTITATIAESLERVWTSTHIHRRLKKSKGKPNLCLPLHKSRYYWLDNKENFTSPHRENRPFNAYEMIIHQDSLD
jgi:hypothetical protein